MEKYPALSSILRWKTAQARLRMSNPRARVAAGSVFVALVLVVALYPTSSAATGKLRGFFGKESVDLTLAATPGYLTPAVNSVFASIQNRTGIKLVPEAASEALNVERRGHTATRLQDGRVLIVGGENQSGPLSSSEIFDPSARTFSLGAEAGAARTEHAAVRLNDGRIFIAGGRNNDGNLDSTEIFDPSKESFTGGPSLGHARAGLSATLMADGRVLIVGGDEEGTAEIFDPQTESITALDETLNTARLQHSALLLKNGKILIVSGNGPLGNPIQSGEIFDPADGSFSALSGALSAPRTRPTLRELSNGMVQIIGGSSDSSMEMYAPVFDDFEAFAHLPATTPVADVLNSRTRSAIFHNGQSDALLDRSAHTITEIPQSNMALVAGGANSGGQVLNSVEVLNSSVAEITTDRIDYAPGELVTINGTGFQPNENITLNLHEEQAVHSDRTFTAVADAEGNFVNTDFTPESHHFGVGFLLTAKGGQSSYVAQTTFTDAASVTTRVTLNPIFRSYGQLAPPIRVNFCQPLTDGTGGCTGINNKTIEFTVGGVAAGSVVTSTQLINNVPTDGVAVLPYDVLKNAGAYTIIAKFAGDDVLKLSQGTATLTVGKVTATILTWPNPQAPITYGTPLSAINQNATIKDNTSASQFTGQEIPGTFAFSPVAGTVLTAGNSKSLSVTFTPADTINYSVKTAFSTINVAKAPLSVTPNSFIRLYGEQNPALNGVVNGLQNGDNITASYSTTATPATAVGTYDITATLSDPNNRLVNYILTNNKGTLGVNKAPLTITADNKVKEYGADNPAFTASYTGFVNNETTNTPGVLSALPTLTSTATVTSPINTYPINLGGSITASNYNITLVNGTLTVNQATSVITLGNLAQTYDGTPKPVTVTTDPPNIDGLVVTYDGSTTPPTNAGSYAVVASLNNPNYANSSKTATLVINKADQVGNFPQIPDKTYGDPPFELSGGTNSGLPVRFELVSGNATIAGNVLTINGTGPIVVSASQLGNNNYNAWADTPQTFNVAKAQASITLDPASLTQTYDGQAKHVSAVTTPAGLSGITILYNQNNAGFTDPINAGNYDVIASLTNPNFEAPNVTATMVINRGGVEPGVLGVTGGTFTYDALAHPATSSLVDADGKLLRVDFNYNPEAGTNPGADPSEPPLPPKVREPQMRQVGPIDPNTGFPLWYEDANGLRLALCLDNSPLCLTTLPDQTKPALVAANEADSNFPDEAFWWSGQSDFTSNGVNVLVLMASEAAFANRIQTGDQMSFGRIRFRLDNLVAGGTYRITHPYGVDTFENVLPGRRGINFTEDIGIDNFPNGFLRSRIAPFLTWDTFGLTATEGAPPAGFVGDPTIEHKVTGSPLIDASGRAQNYVRVERLDPVTRQVIQVVGESDLFTVAGKTSGLNVVPHPRSGAYNATGNSVRLLATNPQATIYYTTTTTTDGTAPADPSDPSDPANAARVQYNGSVSLGTAANLRTTIKFVAVDASGNLSPVVTETYLFDPTVVGPNPPPAPASQLKGVGPLNPATGFPLWYEDETGLRLQLCLDNTPLCLTTVPDQEHAAIVADHEADSNFIDESFWWSGDAQLTGTGGVTARLTLGSEAAFTARVQNGDQISFGRVRIRIDNLVAGGTYRITHPYGVDTFENVSGGVRGVNFTEDIGIDSFPDGAMRSRIAPFLKWDTYGQLPEAGGPPAGYIGDPTINHRVQGSPLNQNFFRIERLDPVSKQVIEVVGETDLFAVSGKLVNNEVPPVYAGTYNVLASFAGNANLQPATTTTQIIINKAEPTVDLTTDGTVDYDGNPHPASVSISGIGGMRFVTPPVTITYTLVATGESTTVAPSEAGTYEVTATFAGTKNYNAKTVSSQLVINQTNHAPQVDSWGDSTSAEGSAYESKGSFSDPDKVDSWTATVDYGDGTGVQPLAFIADRTFGLSHVYTDNGSYKVIVTVTDQSGAAGSATAAVVVSNVAPTPTITVPSTVKNEGTQINLGSTVTDPGEVDTKTGFKYLWVIKKDGNPYAQSALGDGTIGYTNYSLVPDDNGTYVVTLKVTDKDGGASTVSNTITVSNVAPKAVITGVPIKSSAGTPVNLGSTVTDPGQLDTKTGFKYLWTVKKNGVAYSQSSISPAPSINSYSFTPDEGGTYTITLSVTDKDGATGTTSRTIFAATVETNDYFNDNSMDVTKWYVTGTPGVTIAEQNGQLQITPPPSTTGYDGYFARTNFDLTNRRATVEAVQTTPNYGIETYFLLADKTTTAQNDMMFVVGGPNLLMEDRVNGVVASRTVINIDPAQHRFWRIRHDPATDTINWETSPDGLQWTVRHTAARRFNITKMQTQLLAGKYTATTPTMTAIFDNYRADDNPAPRLVLSDNFDDNTRDAVKWNIDDATNTVATALEQNQRLEIAPAPQSTGYNGFTSANSIDFTNTSAAVEVLQSTTGSSETHLQLSIDDSNNIITVVSGGNIIFQYSVNGVRSRTYVPYDPAQHRFWRIRHDISGDEIVWETSADNVGWVVQRTAPRPLALTSMRVRLIAGKWTNTNSTTPGTAIFDNLKVERTKVMKTTDNFNDNLLNTSLWQVFNPASYVTVREQNQRIEMALQPNTASFNGVISVPQINFWNETLSVEIPQATNVGGASAETYFRLIRNDSNYFHVLITGDNTFVCDAVADGVLDRTSFNYNPAANRFWRFRHDAARNTMNFESSADGATWTTLKTVNVNIPLDNMRTILFTGVGDTSNSTTLSAVFDNLKLERND